MSRKRKGARRSASKRKNPSKGHRRHHRRGRNPSGMIKKAGKSAVDLLIKGAGVAAGILGADAIAQNVLPTRVRTSSYAPAAKAAASVVTGLVLSMVPVKIVQKIAEPVAIGGVAKAGYDLVAPQVLPHLEFNVLGEHGYLGELDTRFLTLGQYDRRVITRAGLGEAPVAPQPANRVPFGLPG